MSAFTELVTQLEARVDEIIDVYLVRMRRRIPDAEALYPGIWERARGYARQSILLQLGALRQEALPGSCPEVDRFGASEMARAGGTIDALLAGYRVAQTVLWEAWFDLVERRGGEERRHLIERGSHFIAEYADWISKEVSEVFEATRTAFLRNAEQRRIHLIRAFLDGDDVAQEDVDWPMEQKHLAVIGWGPRSNRLVTDLADGLERRALVLGALRGTWWAWLTGSKPLRADQWRHIRALHPAEGVQVAVGAEGVGANGFRRTHYQALRAQAVAVRTAASLTLFDDVALETLAMGSVEQARQFVESELGELRGGGTRSRHLQETLAAYFSAGHNAAAAAARLGVHQQTVANRLKAIESRLGRPVEQRRAELELALRLDRVLG